LTVAPSVAYAYAINPKESAMKTIKSTLFYRVPDKWSDGSYAIFNFDASSGGKDPDYIRVMPVEFTLPADWNPIPAQVAALEAQKEQAARDYADTLASINERLSKLLALTNEVQA
jgi:hypothetical protein